MTIKYLDSKRLEGVAGDLTSANLTSGTGGWKEVGRTTLGSAGDTITVSSLANKRYYMVLGYKQSSGTTDFNWRVGNGSADVNDNYSRRQSSNGGTDTTNIGYNRMFGDNGGASTPSFQVGYFANKSGKEKFNITHSVSQGTAGAIPTRRESVNKWTNTSLIDVIQGVNVEGGDFVSGSEVVVLGWDESDTHTKNFWEELASVELGSATSILSSGVFTAKKYLWVQIFSNSSNASLGYTMRFNSDNTTSYARRVSSNGANPDSTNASQAQLNIGNPTAPNFGNYFIINNSANEKLLIGHTVDAPTAGSGNPPSRSDGVGKWSNTTSQITTISIDAGTGTWDTGSIIKVWGSN